MKRYSDEQIDWIRRNNQSREWENMKAFTNAFNSRFGTNKAESAIATVMQKRGILLNSKCNNSAYTDEQKKWIAENVSAIEWRNQKHFVNTFNALFGTDRTLAAMNTHLFHNGLSVKTRHNTSHWTQEMDDWLRQKYDEYDCYFVKMAKDFNAVFGTDKTACCITKHLIRMGVHKPLRKGAVHKAHGIVPPKQNDASERVVARNRGMYVKGQPSAKGELSLGTIRYNSDGRPFVKVKLCNGENSHSDGGHNYREPWWKPLQKKIWEDHYGEVPEGYVVCSLNGDPNSTDIRNIGIIDKRGTTIMAKNGWWTDNRVITGDGARWCNLYYVAKDSGINVYS